jgi:tetratricopeptide (TPR) repeat protein
VVTAEGRIDYRLKDASAKVKKGILDLDIYHTNPAIDEMKTGSLYRSVKANLDFSLRHSPNHHIALQTLVKYEYLGGKDWDFPETGCYLAWAVEYAPDDPEVRFIGGYYLWVKKDLGPAEQWYEKALEINPGWIDARYNLGLIYFEQEKYAMSLQQAEVIYSLGYPFDGLRQKLEQLGYRIEVHATHDPEKVGSVQ